MRMSRLALFTTALASMFPACSKDDSANKELVERIDTLEKQLIDIERRAANAEVPDWVGERLNKVELAVEAINAKLDKPTTTTSSRTRRSPSTDAVYSIPVDGSPGIGPKDAKVVIVEAMEFACPACERSRPFVDSLVEEFAGQSVRIVHKHFIVHPTRATIPAQAACAAHRQGKYAAYEVKLWEGFKARKFDGGTDDTDDVIALASGLGMNMSEFERDLAGYCKTYVQNEHEAMRKIGTAGTPTFFINGRVLQSRTLDEVKKMVEEEMDLANDRIASGTRASDYYSTWIVGQGKTSM